MKRFFKTAVFSLVIFSMTVSIGPRCLVRCLYSPMSLTRSCVIKPSFFTSLHHLNQRPKDCSCQQMGKEFHGMNTMSRTSCLPARLCRATETPLSMMLKTSAFSPLPHSQGHGGDLGMADHRPSRWQSARVGSDRRT